MTFLLPVWAFLKRLNLSQIALVAMAALCLFLKLSLASEQRHSAKVEAQLVKSEAGRAADRASYERAQKEAAALNKAKVDAIEAEQEKINAEQKSNYQRDLARVRAGGVRQDLAADQRPASGAQAGSVPTPACRDDEANLCVSRARVVQAAEIELGRNALIEWIEQQIAVKR